MCVMSVLCERCMDGRPVLLDIEKLYFGILIEFLDATASLDSRIVTRSLTR